MLLSTESYTWNHSSKHAAATAPNDPSTPPRPSRLRAPPGPARPCPALPGPARPRPARPAWPFAAGRKPADGLACLAPAMLALRGLGGLPGGGVARVASAACRWPAAPDARRDGARPSSTARFKIRRVDYPWKREILNVSWEFMKQEMVSHFQAQPQRDSTVHVTAQEFRGNHLSNTTCLTHYLFESVKTFGNL